MTEQNFRALLQEAVNAVVTADGNKTKAAEELGLPRTTLLTRLSAAEREGIEPTVLPPSTAGAVAEVEHKYKREIRDLKAKLDNTIADKITQRYIRKQLFKLSEAEANPPEWVVDHKQAEGTPGIPTLLASDWHWGEVVNPDSIDGANEYNLDIAHRRWRTMVEKAIKICTEYTVNPEYPGFIFALGGDMVSGDIHDELRETNEKPLMEIVLDFFDHLVWAIDKLADTFGKVFVPCAYGNHGRNTKGYVHKNAAATNFDWLLYNMLERHYKAKGDDRVFFLIPNSYDSYYRVFGTSYVLTHGDRMGVRGGNGIIGLLGPVARGVNKIRYQYNELGKTVDYVLMGHWHNTLWLKDAFVNGCGKGYDEYAASSRFSPEVPQQSLWFTHPNYGVTVRTTLFLEDPEVRKNKNWIEVFK